MRLNRAIKSAILDKGGVLFSEFLIGGLACSSGKGLRNGDRFNGRGTRVTEKKEKRLNAFFSKQ